MHLRWLVHSQILLVPILLLLAHSAAAQTRDENWPQCKDVANADLAIGACTTIIQSGHETTADLAGAFSNRGAAYNAKRQYDRAIKDYDQAIRLNPNYANAFSNRCVARALAGQAQAALADCDESLRLRPGHANTLDNRAFASSR